jgi:dipeptidyl aminopeptidase/acylaminoacyl peptidase
MHSFFPDSYMLSQAVMRALYTGGSPGEVLAAVDALPVGSEQDRVAGWTDAWLVQAERCAAEANDNLSRHHVRTAREAFLRACVYYQWAAVYGCDYETTVTLNRHSRAAFARFAELSEPPIQAVRVPYGDGYLPAWFVPPKHADGSMSVAVYLPGWDSTKEQGYSLAAELAERGVATLLLDGPGIGEALHELKLVNRHDYEVPGRAAVDYVLSRGDVAEDGVFVIGSSLGGYRAGRVCAFEDRLAGGVIWGAMWDFGAAWRTWAERGVSPTGAEHALRALGVGSLGEVSEALDDWTLDGVADRISCPLLVVHGANDAQVPTSHAERTYEAAASDDKTLRIFGVDELGSAHCQNDHRLVAHTTIADWVMDRRPTR